MPSLSDQIDRFTRNTRAINAAASQTANTTTAASVFTRAVLYTQLGDLIRDIDPSELGLFTLVEAPSTNPYDKDSPSSTHPKITRTQFQGATPLKKRPTRQDLAQEIEPEIYAHAALKYIDQYEPIRPMPRAYDRILNILNRLDDVRQNIDNLNQSLKHAAIVEEVPLIKTRLESEERDIKDLKERIAELSKKKQNLTKIQKPKPSRSKVHMSEPPKEDRVRSPSSPKAGPLSFNTGQTGRTLRFTDNLLHENMNLGDVGEASFDSPIRGPSHLGKLTIAEADSFIEELTITQVIPSQPEQYERGIIDTEEEQIIHLPSQNQLNTQSEHHPSVGAKTVSPSNKDVGRGPETPGTRQPRIKVNREVEKIVAKIWATISDTLSSPKGLSSPSSSESISYIQSLASQTPQLESPITSTASSASIETNSAPTIQQVLTAHLLMMLLSATPHYALPLSLVKENLALKAKASGISVAGQGTTRILYGCVAKRLVKIDRSGREQIVKFDV